jgi:hypothetical protein
LVVQATAAEKRQSQGNGHCPRNPPPPLNLPGGEGKGKKTIAVGIKEDMMLLFTASLRSSSTLFRNVSGRFGPSSAGAVRLRDRNQQFRTYLVLQTILNPRSVSCFFLSLRLALGLYCFYMMNSFRYYPAHSDVTLDILIWGTNAVNANLLLIVSIVFLYTATLYIWIYRFMTLANSPASSKNRQGFNYLLTSPHRPGPSFSSPPLTPPRG